MERRSTGVCHALAVVLLAGLPADVQAEELSGRALDPQDQPVAGATIRLSCPSASGETVVVTDTDGSFQLTSAARESCQLTAEAAGFLPYRRTLSGDADEITIELELRTVRSEIIVSSSIPEFATERVLPGDELGAARLKGLAEMFRGVEGMSAIRRGTVNLEPTIRGLQEDQVGMFVDGTRTFAAGPARMDSNISHVGSHAAQNIRVVKGPYALAWGSGTLAALEVETVRPDFTSNFQWNGSAGAAYGDNASRTDAHLGVWGSNETFRFYVGAGRRDGDDYEDGDGTLVPADFESTETRWRFGFRPSESLAIDYSGGYQEQFDLDYPGRLLDATYFYARSHVLELTWNGDGAVSEVFGQIYANHKDHLMNNDEKPTAQPAPGRIPPFAIEVALPTESNTTGGRFKVALDREEVEWSFGVDGYRVEQTASRTISRRSNGFVLFEDIVWPDAEIENLGGWVQAVRGVGDGPRLGATVRLDTIDATADRLSPFFLANTTGDVDQSETHLSAALSAQWDLGEHWSLDLGVGRAVRTATVLERYSDRFPATKFQIAAELMGNPELDPEQSLELDLGVRGRYGDLLIEAAVFHREIDDYITIIPDPSLRKRLPLSPPVVYRYVNGSRATFSGGELLLRQRVNDHFSWRGSLSYVRADDEALDEPVLGISPLNGELGARFHALGRRLWLDLAARFADRQDRVAVSRFEQETPGYAVYDLAAGFELEGGWRIEAAVENLTDRSYADHLNSPNPFTRQRIREIGRNVRLGFTVDF